MQLTDRSAALYRRLDRPWDQAANALFAARAAISAGDERRAVDACDEVEHWLAEVDDPWLHVRRDAMLGELARLQRRFDDAVTHIARAAATSRRRGYLQTEAYQVASLGRAQCQAGDHRRRRGHPRVGDRQGRGDRGRAHGRPRPRPPRTRPPRPRRGRPRPGRARRGGGLAPPSRRWRTGPTRRVPARRARRRRWRPRCRRATGDDPRCRPRPRRGPRRGVRPRRPRPPCSRTGRPRRGPRARVSKPTGGWRSPPTSSPTTTAPTPTSSGSSPDTDTRRRGG